MSFEGSEGKHVEKYIQYIVSWELRWGRLYAEIPCAQF